MSRVPRIDAADSGFFVLRTPLLPIGELLEHGDGVESPTADDGTLEGALARDRRLLRERLAQLVERPEIREALFVASPALVAGLEAWRREPESRRGRTTERALVRYLQRMTTRSTPFGLFSGYSVGQIAGETNLELPPLQACTRATRLDMGYLFALVDAVEADPGVREEIRFRPNPTRYEVAGRLHYVVRTLEAGARAHRLVAVELADYLVATLQRAAEGATVQELTDSLVDSGAPVEQARAYVETLVRERMLVSDLELPITGSPSLPLLIERLGELPAASSTHQVLDDVAGRLAAIDRMGLGVPPDRYVEIEELLRPLVPDQASVDIFQVDMAKPAPGLSLDPRIVKELLRGVERLRLLTVPNPDPLADLRKAFQARYEEQEVPLLEAFDDDVGIGLDALPPPRGGGDPGLLDLERVLSSSLPASWGPRESLLLDKLVEAARDNASTIELTEAEALSVAPDPLPQTLPSFAVMATLVAGSQSAVRNDNFDVVVHGAFGPSGARMLARFTGADEELRRWVEQHLREEEAREPDVVFAEVAHLPQARLGNVVHRPLLRGFEIDYLGPSGAPPDRRISLSDLGVSLVDEAFVLRSSRLGRRVVPRISSAIGLHLSVPPLFRFLGLLQHQQGPGGMSFDWGPLAGAAYLPRVRMGRTVLALARWLVRADEIERLRGAPSEDAFREVQHWRAERRLPRLVRFGTGGGSVVVDLDNVLSVSSLLNLLGGRTAAVLTEVYPPPELMCVGGPEGKYVHELLVPFVLRSTAVPLSRDRASLARRRGIRRTFGPGSEWLYLKLYGGRAAADLLLREEIGPLCQELAASDRVDRWFFVRYGDPDPHLRLRLHGEPDALHDAVLPAVERLAERGLESGRLWRLQIDTYEREVERYGGPEGIEISEGIFHADSVAVARALRGLPPDEDRLALALLCVNGLFDGLGLGLEEKARSAVRLKNGLAKRAQPGEVSETELSQEFRRRRVALTPLDARAVSEPLAEALGWRSAALAPLASELRRREREGRLSAPVTELAENLAHLNVNRVFREISLLQELRVYDFLARLYRSEAALLAKVAAEPPAQT